MKVTPLSNSFAGEISGADLRHALSQDDVSRIVAAFEQHHVLVFRDQALSKAQQLSATRQFGDLDVHADVNAGLDVPEVHTVSNVDSNGVPRADRLGSQHWHSDKSYRLIPSTATFLHAVELPPSGGDTQFADTGAAFDALGLSKQTELRALKVVHDWARSVAKTTGECISEVERRRWPPVAHPLARRQANDRHALFMGQHASHILGKPIEDGEEILAALHAHATQEAFVYVHQWQPGDLLMWDNRCLLHRAMANFDGDSHRRILHRTVTKGTSAPI